MSVYFTFFKWPIKHYYYSKQAHCWLFYLHLHLHLTLRPNLHINSYFKLQPCRQMYNQTDPLLVRLRLLNCSTGDVSSRYKRSIFPLHDWASVAFRNSNLAEQVLTPISQPIAAIAIPKPTNQRAVSREAESLETMSGRRPLAITTPPQGDRIWAQSESDWTQMGQIREYFQTSFNTFWLT